MAYYWELTTNVVGKSPSSTPTRSTSDPTPLKKIRNSLNADKLSLRRSNGVRAKSGSRYLPSNSSSSNAGGGGSLSFEPVYKGHGNDCFSFSCYR